MTYKVALEYFDNLELVKVLLRDFKEDLKKLKSNDLVLLKPNMFMMEDKFYTNPKLMLSISKFFKEYGCKVIIAERLDILYKILDKYPEIKNYAKIISLDDFPTRKIIIPNATSLRQEIEIPEIIFECDFFIGVPQFRTHAGVLMSNSLKNMVGILPRFTTRIIHNVGLTEAIVDINRIRKQDLIISDFSITIEGNYPIEGHPVNRGIILIGNNALASDIIASQLTGFNYKKIEYLNLAAREGMGPTSIEMIEILNLKDSDKFICDFSANFNGCSSINLYIESACDECKRYCKSLALFLKSHIAKNFKTSIVSGHCNIEQLSNENSLNICVGNCTYSFRNKGIYLEGCPPRAIQAVAVKDWINTNNVDDKIKNQCRWKKKEG